ncbi:MAG: GTP pyrophosphokinase [bacterium]|nr:GTP pyrophosphokinase [bacterium]
MKLHNHIQIEKALEIALDAHRGQVDKAGKAYILHPLRLLVEAKTEEEQIVALLHDVVEDSDVTLDGLRTAGFSDSIIKAINLLTRRSEDTYEDFIEKVRTNELARHIKILDLRDNMQIDRIPNPSEKDLGRIEKYKKAAVFLEAG